CRRRGQEFVKLLLSNLGDLSALAGFDPGTPSDTWHARPTHTLVFAEVLSKIYASDFGVGEILFLFTNREHLQHDDPFPLQTGNEAKDSPLGLPDDDEENSLSALRKKLLGVEVSAERAGRWTWARMETALRDEFGFAPAGGNNSWLSLGHHFFPTALAESGIAVSPLQRQYRVPLPPPTSAGMWNTPPDGPFRYDATAQELWTQLPLADEDVLAKLGPMRQLAAAERQAVQDLYFLPRADVAHFALLFDNFGEAEERLIQEPDEAKRWAWFQTEFERFHLRCQVIAEHLAAHTAATTGVADPEGAELARLLLKHLWAGENPAVTPWENDNGQPPAVTWSHPGGGAYAALLGLTGTGMRAEYFDASQTLRWREVRGGLDAFGPEENAWNAPVPTVLPSMSLTLSPGQLRFAAVRNGFAMTNVAGGMLGGAEPFTLRWRGLLLIEKGGEYNFSAGAPTAAGEVPDFEKANGSHRWRVRLTRGPKSRVLLSHDWPAEGAPADCARPVTLKEGFYELSIEFERKPPAFDGPEDVCPQHTGFQLKYTGPDTDAVWSAVPHDKLFLRHKDATLLDGIGLTGAARDFLSARYTGTVRDARDTYERAVKAMLLVTRFGLSAKKIADDGQSELGYMLAHPSNFAGQSYYRGVGGGFVTHKVEFNLNFLPVLDNYEPPSAAQDQRRAASARRSAAMFDWWVRLFDYTAMRREIRDAPRQAPWLLFHESAESHTDSPADLVRFFGIDVRRAALVLQYHPGHSVTSADLEDDRWAGRALASEKYLRALHKHFYAKDIRQARPDLWASDDPSVPETAFGSTDSGNHNLTRFYRDGCVENGEPRRYEEIRRLNDGLRLRGRAALVDYLTRMNRVALPWGGFATEAGHLSELLLLDVEAGLCQKASRVEEAASAVQTFVQRARLGLESGFVVSPD
ncbi:MAG TPA: neuraminidase-like domain-containing protein, partial [Pyrinomonadaceae bacterium]